MIRKLCFAVVSVFLVLTWTLASAAQVPIAVYPNPIQFGTVALNSPSYPLTVFLSNTTATAVDITGITISGSNKVDFAFNSPACVGTILGNSYCQMSMIFTPSAMGARAASLLIAVTGVSSPISVALQGTGGNPIPTITSLSPANVYAGGSTTTITINGSGFLSSSLAYLQNFQSTSLLTTYVSSTQIKAQVPASALSQTGSYQLYVSNPPPAGGSSVGATFQVIGLEPSLGSVSPVSLAAGSAPTAIVLSGSNFMTGAKVQWNGVNLPTTYVNSGELQAVPTSADLATAGIVQLSVLNPSPGTLSSAVTFDVTYPVTITVLDLPANDLVWDPFAQVIYASLPSSYGPNGNSIAVINPSSGAVTGYHFAGSEPTKIALSATSNYLYVGLNGSNSVQRFDLPTFAKDIDVNLGSATNGGPYVAEDIKVSPSNSHTFAVALNEPLCCTYSGPLVFYTDSTKLANSVASPVIQQIIFPTATTLYGYSNYTVSQVAVTSIGGTLTQQWSDLVSGTAIQYDAGLIYGGAGPVFNPATGLLLGTYDVGNPPCCNSTQVLPDAAINRAFALGTTPFFSSLGITSYNLSEFIPLAVASLAELGSSSPSSATPNFIQWGTAGLAFILQTGCCGNPAAQVVLLQSPSLFLTASKNTNPLPLVKSLTPASAPHGGGNFILTVRGSNFVPGSAVTWNGKSVFSNYQSPTELRVYVPAADISSSGTADVLVKNPEPGGGKSTPHPFVVK